jgi:hypothetical protein
MKFEILSDGPLMKFRLSEVDKSYANALRRTMLGNIPILVLKPKDCTIEVNTSRFTNEIISSRLSAVPIFDKNISHSYTVSLSKKNTGSHSMYVSMDEFKVMKDGKEVPSTQIFRADPISKRYIDFIRLRENLSNGGEEIVISGKTSVGTANECGNYNCVGTCAYSFTHDPEAAEQAFMGSGKNREDFECLESKRYTKPNSFDFTLESVGIHTNRELLLFASVIIREQLNYLETSTMNVEPSLTTIENCFDVKITGSYNHGSMLIEMNGDYTIGKLIEHQLYTKFSQFTYVSFFKSHPHSPFGTLRLAFKDATADKIREEIILACQECSRNLETFSKLVESS